MKSLAGFAFYVLGFIFACYGIEQKIILDRCVVPKPPMFGSITIDADNKLLKYKCDKGFGIAFGKPTRWCEHKDQGGGKYYDWSGLEPMCYAEGRTVRSCPKINDPENGRVSVSSYSRKGKAHFVCNDGYDLIPPDRDSITCRGNLRWSDNYPTCQDKGSLQAVVKNLGEKFINKKAAKSADSEDGIQENLSVGKSGLDLVFALDTSSSIGPDSLETAKKFIKIICGKFGISNQTDGGVDGTRIALLTFSDKVNISFNLADPKVRSMDAVFEAVDAVKSGGGGTDFFSMLAIIREQIFTRYFGNKKGQNERSKQRKLHANRAIFIITDAKETSNDGAKALTKIRILARKLRTDDKFEMFAIGIGTQIKKTFLAEIASPPYYEHVFEINHFEDLKAIGEIISEESIDYGKCGISGNTEAQRDGLSNEGAWPWLGWITVHHGDGRVITCGGALLCDKWFVTLANCVTEKTEEGLTTMEDRINVYLGDHDIQKGDDHEMMVAVKSVRVHPNYTGDLTEHNVAPYDIALLELGEDNTTTPKLNKFVRPLCFPESRVNTSYNEALAILSSYKTFNQKKRARVAGWGHIGRQKIVKPRMFPWNNVKQIERELQKNDLCEKRYPGLDSDMFHCVGNVYQPEFNWCYGDIGGPLMAETLSRRYTFLGLALKTKGCEGFYEFSLFLNVLHPEINKWVERQLRGCNRVDEPIPYVEEEPEVAGNDSESSAAVDDADAVDNDNDNANDDSEVVDGVGGRHNDNDDGNDDAIEWVDGEVEWLDDSEADDDDDDQGNDWT